MNIFMLLLDQMTIWDVKDVASSGESKENSHQLFSTKTSNKPTAGHLPTTNWQTDKASNKLVNKMELFSFIIYRYFPQEMVEPKTELKGKLIFVRGYSK